jgi:protein-tyrosine sulfotransferase
MDAPIFVLSNFRSGSTLLRYLLDAHPAVCCPSELRLAQLCQQLFNSVELTTTSSLTEYNERSTHRVDTVRRTVDELMESYCCRKGKERWCDKSPANAELLYVLGTVFPDAHYICLHRHALDQVHSTLDVEPHRVKAYLARYSGDAVAAALDRWCAITEKLLAFEHAYHRRTVRMTYEGLVEAPDCQMTRLMQFLGLRVVAGLSAAAFEQTHDPGPRDPKIASANAVEPDRVGMGRTIDLAPIPRTLRDRTARLLEILGYPGASGPAV